MISLVASGVLLLVFFYLRALSKTPSKTVNRFTRPVFLAFCGGYLLKMGLSMWYQDMIGLQEFLRQVEEYWMDINPMVGGLIAFCGFAMCYAALRRVRASLSIQNKKTGEVIFDEEY